MLLIRTDQGSVFAPVVYETGDECEMVATKIEERTSHRPECLPAHYAAKEVQVFQAARKAKRETAIEKAQEIAKLRPQLEAERQSILSDRIKRNTLRYMERLKEIEALIGPPLD